MICWRPAGARQVPGRQAPARGGPEGRALAAAAAPRAHAPPHARRARVPALPAALPRYVATLLGPTLPATLDVLKLLYLKHRTTLPVTALVMK